MHVQINGRELSGDEIGQRYYVRSEGITENPIQNLMDIVRQREQTYGRNDHAAVELVYHPNGGPAREWRWPEK
jgi:phage tail protein X